MQDEYISTNLKLPTKQWMKAKQRALKERIPLWKYVSQGLELRLKQEKPVIYGKQMFEEVSGKEDKTTAPEFCYCGKPIDTDNPDCVEFKLCEEHAMEA
jgi:hypothetical protein